MSVPFVDLTREYNEIADEVDDAINAVLESGRFIQAEQVEAFEREFAECIGTEHAMGVNSGSDALTLALQALGIGEGDEVITVSHTFISTANAILKNGARPVFVDVDEETLCMSPQAVSEAITPATKAIIPVHLYGHPVDMDPILELADEHGLAVVEDASQAHGAKYNGEQVGLLGDVGCFSLYPTKNLGAYGDAGVLVTDEQDIAETVRSLRDYGRVDKYRYTEVENHSRLDEIQAAVLRKKLNHLSEYNERRREAATAYKSQLTDTLAEPLACRDFAEAVYHLFVVRHPERESLRQHLDKTEIDTIVHYPIPVHQQPAYETHETRHDLSVTESAVEEIVSLPIHPWIRDDELSAVVDSISAFEATELDN